MDATIKKSLEAIGNNKAMWNKHIEISGETYIYNSAKNEFRQVVNQPGGTIARLVGCMVMGHFVKC